MGSRYFSWLRAFRPKPRVVPVRTRLDFESLEDRLTPATFTINSTLDTVDHGVGNSALTLREAVAAINAGSIANFTAAELAQVNTTSALGANDTIVFSSGLNGGTITLLSGSGGELALNKSATISGPGANLLAISGNNTSRIFNIAASTTVTISGLTIQNGSASSSGGGIRSLGFLTLTSSVVKSSVTTGDGGGVYQNGSILLMTGCTLNGNSADGNGGGVAVVNGAAATIVNSTISGNSAKVDGGGVQVDAATTIIFRDDTIVLNRAQSAGGGAGVGGGIGNLGDVILFNSIVAGNLHGSGAGSNDDLGNNAVAANSANNIIGDFATRGGLSHGTNSNIVGNSGAGTLALSSIVSPSLANNGGPTPTHLLASGSLAINAGNNAFLPADRTSDQRGLGFDRIVDTTVDIGAVEDQLQVLSLTSASPSPTGATSVAYTLAFNYPATNVTAANFVLNKTFTADGVIGTPTTSNGGLTWTINVGSLVGTGNIQLTLNSVTGITPTVSGTFPVNGTTIALNHDNPTASITRNGVTPSSATTYSWTVIFSESVSTLTTSNFSLVGAGASGATLSPLSGSGTTYTVTATNVTGNGSLGLNLVNSTGVTNGVGNAVAPLPIVGQTYTVDRTAPQVTAITRVGATSTNATSVSWTVTFNENVTGVASGNFSLVPSGVTGASITNVTGSLTSWTVTANTGSGDGTLGLNLSVAAGIVDTVNNVLSNTLSGPAFTIDKSPPIVTSIDDGDADNVVFTNATLNYTVSFNEDIDHATVTSVDFNNSGTAAVTIGSISETSPGVFSVAVTPTSAGTLILRLPASAVVQNVSGGSLGVPVQDTDTVFVFAPSAGALVVDQAADGIDGNVSAGNLSLREAIAIANNRAGADTITFSGAVTAITLTGGELAISDSVTITGPGAKSLALSGNNASRIFNIAAGKTVAISGLTLQNGNAASGGAILNLGTLALSMSVLQNNSAANGGALRIEGGSLTLSGSTLSANTATVAGGAISVASSGVAQVVNSTITGNSAAQNGGGIDVGSGQLTALNSTITLNRANTSNSTFKGGGVAIAGTVTLLNSIVAGNLNGSASAADDLFGSAQASSSNNLIGDFTTRGGLTHNTNGNLIGNNGSGTLPVASILSTTLADNGGSTKTHALVQNSLAIGAASASVSGFSPYDQREAARDPSAPDIRAYEVQHPLSPVGTPSTYANTFVPRPSSSANEAFVKGLYQSTLLRAPDSAGLAGWIAALNGGAARPDVAYGFVNSVENRSNQVTFFYKYFLGRSPDPTGLAGWVNILQTGTDEGAVMSGFLLSPEFTGQNDNASFVNLMYYAILGRQAEPAGFSGWKAQLDSGEATRDQVGNGFLRSIESITRVVVSLHSSYLKRTITPSEASPFVTQIQSGMTFGRVAANILGSDEFFVAAGGNMS